MKNIKKVFAFLFIILLLIIYAFYGWIHEKRRFNNSFYKFNKANIKDVIIILDKKNRAATLKINDEVLSFYPLTGKVNDNSIFNFTAEKGDSII